MRRSRDVTPHRILTNPPLFSPLIQRSLVIIFMFLQSATCRMGEGGGHEWVRLVLGPSEHVRKITGLKRRETKESELKGEMGVRNSTFTTEETKAPSENYTKINYGPIKRL